MPGQGNATVAFPVSPLKASEASVAVTGQTGIAASSQIEAWVQGTDSTADHSADEHQIEDFQVVVTALLPGTGFTITLRCRNGVTNGQYLVEWVWV